MTTFGYFGYQNRNCESLDVTSSPLGVLFASKITNDSQGLAVAMRIDVQRAQLMVNRAESK